MSRPAETQKPGGDGRRQPQRNLLTSSLDRFPQAPFHFPDAGWEPGPAAPRVLTPSEAVSKGHLAWFAMILYTLIGDLSSLVDDQ
jgi:hypothetical protein